MATTYTTETDTTPTGRALVIQRRTDGAEVCAVQSSNGHWTWEGYAPGSRGTPDACDTITRHDTSDAALLAGWFGINREARS